MWLPRDKQTNQKIIRMSKNTTAQTLTLKQTFLQLRLYFNVGTKVPLKSAKVFFVQIQTFWMCWGRSMPDIIQQLSVFSVRVA